MVKHVALAVMLVTGLAGSALAQAPAPTPDCPALIQHVKDQVGNRFDSGRHAAIDLAAEAEKLHGDQNPADCVAKVREAAVAAGLTPPEAVPALALSPR